jgi:hypothetical protein
VRLIRILALFATLAALATVLAACGGSGDNDEGGGGPRGLLESADFDGVKSGELELALEIDSQGKEEEVNMRILGAFMGAGEEELPELDMAVEAHGALDGEMIDFDGGLSLLSDRAVINYEQETYEPDPTTFEMLKSDLEEAQQQGEEGDVTACQEAAEGIELSQLIDNLKNEGRRGDLDGTPVTWVSGDLNVSGAIDALTELTEDPACGAQLEAVGPLPLRGLEEADDKSKGRIKEKQVQFAVDRHGVLRDLAVNVTIEPKFPKGEEVEFEFDLRLARVNEITELPVPSPAKPLEALFKKVGVNSLEQLEASGGEGLAGLLKGIGDTSSGGGAS